MRKKTIAFILLVTLCCLSGCAAKDSPFGSLFSTTEAIYSSENSTTSSVFDEIEIIAESVISDLTNTTTVSTSESPSIGEAESGGGVEIPSYSGTAYSVVNNNIPFFTEEEREAAMESYEVYSDLDSFGRCGVAMASIGVDLMPTEERGAIGSVKPTGWHTIKFDFVDGKYLYNRCHLIGFQLSGENANEKNLITGTRYLNVQGMLPFENMVADFVKETENHVLYRVTPIYTGDNLIADGVLMEAFSIEDAGDSVCFNVFVHNIQPGVVINYATGTAEEE